MTYFEQIELQGQTNIFDFLPTKDDVKRNKAFFEGDVVKVRYYHDEYEILKKLHPELLQPGVIVGKKLDFYIVEINDVVIYVEGSKLVLV